MHANTSQPKGFTMLETLVAIGIAAIFLSGMISLLLIADRSSENALLYEDALWHGSQGIEALQSIAFTDLSLTEVGSLSFASNQWVLGTSGPETLANGMQRTVRVQEVLRDVDCEIALVGTVDDDSLFLESEIAWTDASGRAQSQILQTLRTNWEAPEGNCFGSQAVQTTLDVFTDANWHGLKQLRDIHVTNNGSQNVVVAKVTFWWNNSETLQQIFLGSGKIWSSGGPGTPLGDQVSGTELDTLDQIILPGETLSMSKIQFTDNMTGTTVILKFEFGDGSSITTDPFVPNY